MLDFEKARLWKESLGRHSGGDVYREERERLRAGFFSFRKNAELLAAEIPRDFDFLTVHDITHLDALWEMADLVTAKDERLSPLEAFVLGGAFLVHDLGMGVAAYPHGFGELQQRPEFKDLVTVLLTARLGRRPSLQELKAPNKGIIDEAKFRFIRNLHAARAEELVFTTWTDKVAGRNYYLLEDPELRDGLGSIIGRIAHSHWRPVTELRDAFKRPLGAPVGFKSGQIDALKLACILRVADAAHVDARRAPSILKAFRNPQAPSLDHWTFQEHIHMPNLQQEYLVYTSGRPFPASEALSWWLCFDTLRMVDRELRGVDALLVDLKRKRLAARGVAGVEDPSRLAEFIPTAGWSPVDTQVKVSNVAGLVSKLAGEELYGQDPTVPLRELIQNSADAIRARRVLQQLDVHWGDIVVRVGEDGVGHWIEVEDNGVGMSEQVLTGPFLDFGCSLWSTPAVAEEFPTLMSNGFYSTGKYGIGFFSIFMWGERATVTTRRFDRGQQHTRVLEFKSGISARPLLRRARQPEVLKDGGTRVRVWLANSPNAENGVLSIPTASWHTRRQKHGLSDICGWLCPSLDANLWVENKGKKRCVVKASDWKHMNGSKLLSRILLSSGRPILADLGDALALVKNEGQCVGRACILPTSFPHGVITMGGLRSKEAINIRGILLGHSTNVSRMNAAPFVPEEELARWASEQTARITSYVRGLEGQAQCAMQIAALGGDVGSLPIALLEGSWLNSDQVTEWAASHKIVYLVASHKADKCSGGTLKKNVLIEPDGFKCLVDISPYDPRWHKQWDRQPSKNRHPIVRAVAKAWSVSTHEVEVWSGDTFIADYGYGGDFPVDAQTLKLESVEFE
jgi:hypothetical protein